MASPPVAAALAAARKQVVDYRDALVKKIGETEPHRLDLTWRHDGYSARLRAELPSEAIARGRKIV